MGKTVYLIQNKNKKERGGGERGEGVEGWGGGGERNGGKEGGEGGGGGEGRGLRLPLTHC